MLDNMLEKAKELGRVLGQTEEYRALQRARERIADDRDVARLASRLDELEVLVGRALEQGQEPPEDVRAEYEKTFAELQSNPVYQSLVAAQANLDKILRRVNDEIAKGMEAGAQSRIILPS